MLCFTCLYCSAALFSPQWSLWYDSALNRLFLSSLLYLFLLCAKSFNEYCYSSSQTATSSCSHNLIVSHPASHNLFGILYLQRGKIKDEETIFVVLLFFYATLMTVITDAKHSERRSLKRLQKQFWSSWETNKPTNSFAFSLCAYLWLSKIELWIIGV